mmetsp:Transcript_99510/g.276936  ORF Transcript_99510/g.276936 Transcript_99510/m.276936 type:complete len:319 (-) Transcript_99510:1139-2095(-)
MERQRPHVRHAKLRDHRPRQALHALQVAPRAACHAPLTEDEALRRAAGQCAGDLGLKCPARDKALVLKQHETREARLRALRDQGHLVHVVVVRQQGPHKCMACLVVSHEALSCGVRQGGALDPDSHAVQGSIDLCTGNLGPLPPHGQDGRLVQEVSELCPTEAGCLLRDGRKADIAVQSLVGCMHLQNLLPPTEIRQANSDMPVKAPRPQHRTVEGIKAVCGRNHYDAVAPLETVHFCEELIEGLILLAGATTGLWGGPSPAPNGVDLIDEDYARRMLPGLLKDVANSGCANPDQTLHKVRPRRMNERHTSLSGQCSR